MRIFSRLIVLASMLVGAAGCNNGAPPPAIVLGHVSDTTRLDKAGEQAELGIRLALHDLTKDGALAETFAGRKIQVRHTDTRGEIDAFESEAVRLDSINRGVALLGGLSAREVSALDHVKMPILTFHGQPVSGASGQVFYLGMSAVRQGEVLAKVVARNRAVDRIVIVQDERREDGTALVEAFQKSCISARQDWLNQRPVFSTVRFGKDAVWAELADQTLTPLPQAVVFVGSAQDFNAWHRTARKDFPLGQVELVFAGADGSDRVLDLGQGNKSTVLVATAFYADPASEKIQTFLKNYRHLPPKAEAEVHAALAYDSMRVLVEAMKKTPTQLTPEKIREELLTTKDFDGLTGPLTITSDRQVERPVHVMRWDNGLLKRVETFAP